MALDVNFPQRLTGVVFRAAVVFVRGGVSVDKAGNLPEPERMKDLRCDFVWRVIYVTCAALVASYVLFNILDLDGSNWRLTPYASEGPVLVANAPSDSESYPPLNSPLARCRVGSDLMSCTTTSVSFCPIEGSTIGGLSLVRRHRYRIALPRSSIPDPYFI